MILLCFPSLLFIIFLRRFLLLLRMDAVAETLSSVATTDGDGEEDDNDVNDTDGDGDDNDNNSFVVVEKEEETPSEETPQATTTEVVDDDDDDGEEEVVEVEVSGNNDETEPAATADGDDEEEGNEEVKVVNGNGIPIKRNLTEYVVSLLDRLQQDFDLLSDVEIEHLVWEFQHLSNRDFDVEDKQAKIDWKHIIQEKNAIQIFHQCLLKNHQTVNYYHKTTGCIDSLMAHGGEDVNETFGHDLVKEVFSSGILTRLLELMESSRSDTFIQFTYQAFLYQMNCQRDTKKDSIDKTLTNIICEATLDILEYGGGKTDGKLYGLCIHTLATLGFLEGRYIPRAACLIFHGLVVFLDDEEAQRDGYRFLRIIVGKQQAKEMMDHAEFHQCEGGCA